MPRCATVDVLETSDQQLILNEQMRNKLFSTPSWAFARLLPHTPCSFITSGVN